MAVAAALWDRWVLMVTEVLGDAEGLREAEEEPEGEREERGEGDGRDEVEDRAAEKGRRRQRISQVRDMSGHGKRQRRNKRFAWASGRSLVRCQRKDNK